MRCGPQPMKATTIHVSGVCLGSIHTTWDQVATLWTAVFTANETFGIFEYEHWESLSHRLCA